MSNNNGLITYPVNTYDVSSVTVRGSNDVGTLCGDNNLIKIWARFKPVRYQSIDTTGQLNSDKSWKDSSTWWKGTQQNCGLVPKLLQSASEAVTYSTGGLNGWVYQAPRGSSVTPNEPYRLIDFNYYNHNAEPPVGDFRVLGTVTSNKQGGTVAAAIYLAAILPGTTPLPTSLALWDINDIKNCYFAIYCKKRGSNLERFGTASDTIYNGEGALEVSTYGWSTGMWDIYPFLTTVQNDDWTTTGSRYSIPYCVSGEIDVEDTLIQLNIVNVVVTTSGSTASMTATVVLKNLSASSVTLNSNTWKVRFAGVPYDDPGIIGENEGTLSNVTLSASSTQTLTLTGISVDKSTYDSGATLWVRYANTSSTSYTVLDSYELMEE